MSSKRACLQHIYNTGVNLAWAQVFVQEGKSAAQIRRVLRAARGHASAAGFFSSPEGPVDPAIQRLDQFGVGQQALDAIEAALFHFQFQLGDHCCDVQC